MTRFAIAGAEIFDGTKRRPQHAVIVDGARILDVVPESVLPSDLQVLRLDGGVLAPGFIDAQANGGGGVLLNDAPNAEGVRTMCDAHARFGTTAMLPTLITDSPGVTASAVAAVKQAIAGNALGCLGLHLEGPFLSPERRGAHDANLMRIMTDADVDEVLSLGIETLLLTVSPERVAPAIIRRLAQGGVIVSLGHSNATYDQIVAAVDAGARGVTHLYNAMSPLIHRAPGVVGGALDAGELWCGLIADGHHVHPAAIGIALRAKRQPGRIFLVTDAMSTVGSDRQTITLNGRTVWRRNGALELEDGTLAGSDLDMMSGVRYLVKNVGVELGEALRMASTYPAEFLKRADLGHIAAGSRADLVHISDDLKANATWRAGVQFAA
jgi:N-acetylglucosamine-6-phosphate deacetylase